jgi:chaperonin GroES
LPNEAAMIKSTHQERVLTLTARPRSTALPNSIIFQPKGVAMNLRPLNDRVVVKRMEEEQKTAGGIIIPDTAKEKPIQGEVIAAGNGKTQEDGTKRALDVKKGDRVLFGKYAGTEITIEGQEVLIMREDDILAIIE